VVACVLITPDHSPSIGESSFVYPHIAELFTNSFSFPQQRYLPSNFNG
jgi:hypothetical protein